MKLRIGDVCTMALDPIGSIVVRVDSVEGATVKVTTEFGEAVETKPLRLRPVESSLLKIMARRYLDGMIRDRKAELAATGGAE